MTRWCARSRRARCTASTWRWRTARWRRRAAVTSMRRSAAIRAVALRMAVVGRAAGKPARTDVDRAGAAAHGCARCAARCTPGARTRSASTWRRIGHPLVADALYGGAPALGLTRQALHAFRLRFAHPVDAASRWRSTRRCRPIWRRMANVAGLTRAALQCRNPAGRWRQRARCLGTRSPRA